MARGAPARGAVLGLALAAGVACAGGTEDEAPRTLEIGEPVAVVPSAGLPGEVEPAQANNNLDVVRHEGRVFLAFRTGPHHFASAEARLYVVASDDEETWGFEASFFRGTDLREPRLLSFRGRLFLYFAVLGTDRFAFEPQGMLRSERLGPGEWTEPEWAWEPEFIPWRARVVGGEAQLVGYVGGGAIYDPGGGGEVAVHWLRSDDGRSWEPKVPGRPTVLTGGGSETDIAVLDDGAVVAVVRNELGDADGWGSKVCRGEVDAPGDWRCVADPRKYDSPLVVRVGRRVYLMGRRSLGNDGLYDLGLRDLDAATQALRYEAEYWVTPKRCALWEVDPVALSVAPVADLPSRGDTCFPAALELGPGRLRVYNYSSPLDGPDVSWQVGQQGPTGIYRVDVTLP